MSVSDSFKRVCFCGNCVSLWRQSNLDFKPSLSDLGILQQYQSCNDTCHFGTLTVSNRNKYELHTHAVAALKITVLCC